MAIDFSNLAGNIKDKEGNTPTSQNQSSNVPDQIQVGSNPFTDQPIFTQSQAGKDKEMEEKKQQILDMATSGAQQGTGVNFENIVDFREESGMSGSDYMDFLKEIKKRSPLGYDAAGFISGPSDAIQNFIKKGGILGNILSSIFDKGKETGIEAIEKVKEVFTPGGGVTEVMGEVQGPLTGPDKFRKNLAAGDPLGLFDQYNIYGSVNPYKMAAAKKLEQQNNMDGFGLMPFAAMMPNVTPTNVNQFGYAGTVANMDPSSEAFQDMKNMRDFYNQGYNYNLANGGGLFPQPANDPIINSFNKTPLSVLEYAGGGVTPKNAAIELGIVEDFSDGVMGV